MWSGWCCNLVSLVGSVQEVLCEGKKKDGAYTGRTVRNEIVHFGSRADVTGQLVSLRIAVGFKNSLGAELLDETLRIPVGELPRVAGHADDAILTASVRTPNPTANQGETKRQLPVL